MDARAAALARVTAAAKGAPLQHLAYRHCCWECQRCLTVSAIPFSLLSNASADAGPAALALACALTACMVVAAIPCQPCRHAERLSFVLGVTATEVHWTEEDRLGHLCCGCGRPPPPPLTHSARLADVLEVRQGSCCCCCWSLDVLLRDPLTGGRKQAQCCLCFTCNRGPDHSWGCTAEPGGTAQAIRQLAMGGGGSGEPQQGYYQSAPLLGASPSHSGAAK